MKQPRMLATFAALGIQPHQGRTVFAAFDEDQDGLLSLADFMLGLNRLCGTDSEGRGKDLDVDVLRAANWPKYEAIPVGQFEQVQKTKGVTQLPDVQLLPRHKLERAFVHSAMSQALHPASACPRGYR